MIEFSEIQSEAAMHQAIGRRVVQLIEGELEFAAKKGSKGKGGANKKDCKKGISCGASCIAKSKACVKEMSASQKAKYNALLKKVKAGGGGGADAQQQIDKMAADQVAAKTGQQPEPAPVPAAKPAAEAPAKTPKAKAAPKTKSEEVGTVKPTLKAQEYNPYAIKDLDTKDFIKFRQDREFLEINKDPKAAWNQSFAEWKKETGGTLARYKSEILAAISSEKTISPAAIADAKPNKSALNQATENAKLNQQRQERVDQIQKAIDHPLMSADESKGYKALMSEAEAAAYTSGSYAAGLSFYHGNGKAVTDSVVSDGAKPEKNNAGIFGKGFYIASAKTEAEFYAMYSTNASSRDYKADSSGLVSTQVKVKNPFIGDAKDVEAIGSWFPGEQSNGADSRAITEYMRARGYDSIYLKDLGYFVAFEQKQVASYNLERLSETRMAGIVENYKKGTGTWEEVAERASNSPTGQALANQKSATAPKAATEEDLIDFYGY